MSFYEQMQQITQRHIQTEHIRKPIHALREIGQTL